MNRTLGVVQGYEPKGGGPFAIAWINITPVNQRKGYATAAIEWLAETCGKVENESLTDEGPSSGPPSGATPESWVP